MNISEPNIQSPKKWWRIGLCPNKLTRCLKITEKSLIQHCERSELRFCSQTVLPDVSFIIGQKLVENAKIEIFNYDILSNFQTMCIHIQIKDNYQKWKPLHLGSRTEWRHYLTFSVTFVTEWTMKLLFYSRISRFARRAFSVKSLFSPSFFPPKLTAIKGRCGKVKARQFSD